jgi:hypothetical protein
MKAALRFHKIAAWILILMGIVHCAGFTYGEMAGPDSPQEAELLKAMRAFEIPDPLYGPRAFVQIYRGFSLNFSFMSILWGVVCLAAVRGGGSLEFLRRMMRLNTLLCAGLLVLCAVFFITPPTTFALVALIFAILAQWKLPGNNESAGGV